MASLTAAKVRGKVREATSLLTGYPGIFRHLAGEHTEIAALMRRLPSSSATSHVREELFSELYVSLLAHATAEEKEFYPRLRGHAAIGPLVAKALEDHQKIKDHLQQLVGVNKTTKTWLTLFQRLMRSVEAHVDREENELFPAARDVLTAQQAREVEERYREAEERAKERI
jgi:hemerythrin superfamily protein